MISIILIVKNDKGIETTLRDLFFNINKPEKIEVIVVDSSEGRLNDIKNRYPQAVWIHYKNHSKKKITIPEQRNVGLQNAKGHIIVFTDASCALSHNWLMSLYGRYKKGEMIVAGQIKASDEKVINNISARFSENSNYIEECATANVLIDKEVFEKVGDFDEQFEYGSDTDFMWRARNKGYKIFYEKDAVITHDWGDNKQQIKRSFFYGKGRMRLYLKHPERIKMMLSNDPILAFYPLFFFFSPVAVIWPWYLLLLIVPIIKNRNNKPFATLILNSFYGLGGLYMLIQFLFAWTNKHVHS